VSLASADLKPLAFRVFFGMPVHTKNKSGWDAAAEEGSRRR
jgi:hypothetical protein